MHTHFKICFLHRKFSRKNIKTAPFCSTTSSQSFPIADWRRISVNDNFIIMLDFKVLKGKKQYNSVTKSNTTVTLPGIQKTTITANHSNRRNKSTYLDTISHIASNVQYQKKDTFYVNKQQNTLKTILKKMNKDTMQLIEGMKPKKSPRVVTIEHQNITVEKEVQNSRKAIGILKHEIENLKDKYSRIVEHQEEQQIIKKISATKQQIQRLKMSNIQEKFNVSKDGKEILKQFSDEQHQKMIILETDNTLTSNKLEKLRGEAARVVSEGEKLLVKLKEADPLIQQLELQFLKVKTKKEQEQTLKLQQSQYNDKKSQLQLIKKKMQAFKNFGQVRYYKLLKDLQAQTAVCSMIDKKTIEIQNKSQFIKEQVDKLQIQFTELKRKRRQKDQAVKEYLQTERKSRVAQNSRILPDFTFSSEQLKMEIQRTDSELVQQRSIPSRQIKNFDLKEENIAQQQEKGNRKIDQNKPSLIKINLPSNQSIKKQQEPTSVVNAPLIPAQEVRIFEDPASFVDRKEPKKI